MQLTGYRTAIPLLFVFLWSTGFIGAKGGLPYSEPFTFLAIRMALTVGVIFCLLPFFKPVWPKTFIAYFHIAIVGILVHGIYLGGVFAAIDRGMSAGISAMIVGLQPALTAILAALWLKEKLTFIKVLGLLVGLAGVMMVVFDPDNMANGGGWIAVVLVTASLIGISAGTVYQKKFCSNYDLLAGICIQYLANGLFMLTLALILEQRVVEWTGQFLISLLWLVLVLSIGAVLLLMWLIRIGESSHVASLFYLVPPCVAIQAWLLFGETFSVTDAIGLTLCVLGVALVVRPNSVKN